MYVNFSRIFSINIKSYANECQFFERFQIVTVGFRELRMDSILIFYPIDFFRRILSRETFKHRRKVAL